MASYWFTWPQFRRLLLTLLGLQRLKCLLSISLLNRWYVVAYSPYTTNHLSSCMWMMCGKTEIVDGGYYPLHALPVWEGKETICTNSFSQECDKKKWLQSRIEWLLLLCHSLSSFFWFSWLPHILKWLN